MKSIVTTGLLLALAGCAIVPLPPPNNTEGSEEFRSYRDQTLGVPNRYFTETTESKSVIAGSSLNAYVAGCTLMQRYKIRTNVDFSSSLNLFKYRSALMGAERISIVKHEEINPGEKKIVIDDGEKIFLSAGTSIDGGQYHTTIIGDLFDCPCSTDACKTK